MELEKKYELGIKISKITIVSNTLLSLGKILTGYIGKSSAMLADGVHTLSDVLSTMAVIFGLKMAKKPEDECHPYGHEKIEPVVSKLLAVLLFITAMGIGYSGLRTIIIGKYTEPGSIAIIAAIVSILTKEWMYRYTLKGAKKIESSALMADAWHHRSDALSSVGTLLGITGAKLGLRILDPIAAIIVSILIVKVAIEIYLNAINQLIDKAADDETLLKIKKEILRTKGVIRLDDLKTRVHASKIFVDIEIGVDSELSLKDSHNIAEQVHDNVETGCKGIKHCTVHVNPVEL